MPDTAFVLPLLLQSVLVPGAVALAVLAAARAAGARGAAALLALLAGFVAAFAAVLHAQWSLVPHAALDWLPWIAGAGAAGAFAVEKISAPGGRTAARSALALFVAALLVWPALASFGPLKAVLSALVVAVLLAVLWAAMARPSGGAATRPLLLAVVAGGAGIALMLDSSQAIGQLSGAFAVTLAAATLFAWPRLAVPFTSAAAGFAVLVLGALLANAHLFAGFPLGYVGLLLGALLVDPVLAAVRRGSERGLSWVSAAMLTAIPVAATVALAVKAAQDAGGY